MILYRIVIRMMLSQKRRTLFAILSITLGITLLVSMTLLNQYAEEAIEQEILERFGNYDMMVGYRHNKNFLDTEEIDQIRQTRGVHSATEVLVNPEYYLNQEVSTPTGIYYVGVENSELSKTTYKFNEDLLEYEVIINNSLASKLQANLGDTVEIPMSNGSYIKVKVKEIIEDKSGLAPDMAIFNLQTLQRYFAIEGKANLVLVKLHPEADKLLLSLEWKDLISQDLDIDLLTELDETKENIRSMLYLGYGLGIIVLISSAIFIIGHFQLSLNERLKELSILRTIGAKRTHTFSLVIMEASTLSIIGGLSGLLLGVGLTNQLSTMLGAFMGIAMVNTQPNYSQLVVIVALSSLFIVIAAFIPAWKTSNILPLTTIRGDKKKSNPTYLWFSIIIVLVGLVFFIKSHTTASSNELYLLQKLLSGVILTIGIFLSGIYMVKPFLQLTAPILTILGGKESFIIIRNLNTDKRKNYVTILVIALALTIAISGSIVISNISREAEGNIDKQYATEIALASSLRMSSSLPYELNHQIKQLDSIQYTVPISTNKAAILKDYDYSKSDPTYLKENSQLENWKGTNYKKSERLNYILADLKTLSELDLIPKLTVDTKNAVIFPKSYAQDLGVELGDRIKVIKNDQVTELTVEAIIDHLPGSLTSNHVYVDWSNPLFLTEDSHIFTILIETKPDSIEKAKNELEQIKRDYPEINWSDKGTALTKLNEQLAQRKMVLWAVVILILIIGTLGIINTLSAIVHAKERELAILRSIYLSPMQLKKIIIIQSIILSTIGLIIGIITGNILGYSFTHALGGEWSFLWETHLILIVNILALSILVSIPLARRLGNKSIVQSLQSNY